MTDSTLTSQLNTIISKHYDLGELVDYEQLYLGCVNESYIVNTLDDDNKRKLFLRKYKGGINENEIRFEHSLIKHLISKGLTIVAGLVKAKNESTFIKYPDDDDFQATYYALYDFLAEEDRYTWVDPQCRDAHLKNAAIALARFHSAAFDWIPEGCRNEPPIIELLPKISQVIEHRSQQDGDTVFDIYLKNHLDLIIGTIIDTMNSLQWEQYTRLPKLVIHCDFHPGNIKFQGDEVVGLFDFDWSKMDVRCFDVALALTYFCVAWEGKQDGDFQLSKVAMFLEAYQNILRDTPNVGPLSDIELKFLPYLIAASNIYILNWTITDFHCTEADPHEYLIYLRHSVRFMMWLENKENWGQLKRSIISS